jgi:HPt (histidine-containing phosphotransfer) domain-containing protein
VWAEEEGASSASPEDELKAIYREFDESLPGKYDLVADAVERKDYDAVYRHGHDLKGTGGAFGREKISVLGRQIESAAKEKKDDVLTFLLGSLKDEIESIQKEIQ